MRICLAGLALSVVACAPLPWREVLGFDRGAQRHPVSSPPPASLGPPGPADFSPDRAWLHLESIVRRGPRPAGGVQAAAVRTYLTNRLRASGLQVGSFEFTLDIPSPASDDTPSDSEAADPGANRRATTLIARLAGPSEDLVLVAAPYTSPEQGGVAQLGANAGGSGAAVALELARALAEGPRHYSYLFVFVAGDGVAARPLGGSREVARHLAQSGVLSTVRAGLFLDRVGAAELVVLRDLHSSGPYRDIVWEQAEAQGYAAAFASDGFAELVAGHREFGSAGLRQMVALIDPVVGRAAGPASGEADPLSCCSPESLAVVGSVSLGALRVIESRLDRMDRYAAAPARSIRGDERDRKAASLESHPAPSGSAIQGEGASP